MLKIGRTWNIRLRLAQHRRAKGRPVELIGYIPVSNIWKAIFLEGDLLERFRPPGQAVGEWVKFDADVQRQFLLEQGAVICLPGVSRG